MSVAQYAGTPRPPPFNWGAAQLRVIKLIAADIKEDVGVILDPSDAKAKLAGRHGVDATIFARSDLVGRAMHLYFPRTLNGYGTGLKNIISVENGARHRLEAAVPGMVKEIEGMIRIIQEIGTNTLDTTGKKLWEKNRDDIDSALLEKQLKSLSETLTAVETLMAHGPIDGDAHDARRP